MEEKNNVAKLEVIFYVLYSFIRFIISRFLFIMPFSFYMCALYYDYYYDYIWWWWWLLYFFLQTRQMNEKEQTKYTQY